MKLNFIKKTWLSFSGFFATAVLLTVIQPPIGLSWLAVAAYVPFILISLRGEKTASLLAVSYAVSFFYWLINLYWVGPVTYVGWVFLCLYMAVLWPILVYSLRFCFRKKVPLFIAVAVLVVGIERMQGLFWGGFFWRFLAHSQYENTTIIQIADIFGAGGVSFLLAMVNGLIAELIIGVREKKCVSAANFFKTAIVGALVLGAIFYGRYRISQSAGTIVGGPLVGSVQSNVPQSVKDSSSQEDNVKQFEDVLALSRECAKSGAELIVWPETIVPGILDSRVLGLLGDGHLYNEYDRKLKEQAAGGCYMLVGAHGGSPEVKPDGSIELKEKFNSAFFYRPDGKDSSQYNKIHLVPFGEVVPFRKNAAWLHRLLMRFTPYDYDYSLDAGTEFTVFEMAGAENKNYKFGVVICYEGTVPEIVRKSVVDDYGTKRIDWLVNISNDGWFVKFANGKVSASEELVQHNAIYVFRAVENRIGILRSVNTGVSCLIDPVGRIKDGFAASSENFAEKTQLRGGISGWFADKMPIDKSETFFSRHGQWLDFCCGGAVIMIVILPFGRSVVIKSGLFRKIVKKNR